MNDGSLLLSCKTTSMLGLIQPRTRLDYLPPKSNLITSAADHPKKIKATLLVQKQEVSTQTIMQTVAVQTPKARKEAPKLITSKDQILCEYPEVFEGIGTFSGPSYHIQIDPNVAPILVYYSPKKETVLQTDASSKGLGACLLQEQRPVYFTSRALTEAQ